MIVPEILPMDFGQRRETAVILFTFYFGAIHDMSCDDTEKSRNRRTLSTASHYLTRP
jgi:hypothetical protein